MQLHHIDIGVRVIGVHQHRDRCVPRKQLLHQFKAFRPKQRRVPPKSGDVAAGAVKAPDDAELDGVAAERKHHGYRCRRRLGRQYRRITALGHNEGHMAAHEFCRQCGKPIVVTLRPAVFDRDTFAVDVAGFLETLAERSY